MGNGTVLVNGSFVANKSSASKLLSTAGTVDDSADTLLNETTAIEVNETDSLAKRSTANRSINFVSSAASFVKESTTDARAEDAEAEEAQRERLEHKRQILEHKRELLERKK